MADLCWQQQSEIWELQAVWGLSGRSTIVSKLLSAFLMLVPYLFLPYSYSFSLLTTSVLALPPWAGRSCLFHPFVRWSSVFPSLTHLTSCYVFTFCALSHTIIIPHPLESSWDSQATAFFLFSWLLLHSPSQYWLGFLVSIQAIRLLLSSCRLSLQSMSCSRCRGCI